MARYAFVGFPVQPDSKVEVPDEAVVVGANFTVGNQWQIMCLVPEPVAPETEVEPGKEEEAKGETEEHANVPPES